MLSTIARRGVLGVGFAPAGGIRGVRASSAHVEVIGGIQQLFPLVHVGLKHGGAGWFVGTVQDRPQVWVAGREHLPQALLDRRGHRKVAGVRSGLRRRQFHHQIVVLSVSAFGAQTSSLLHYLSPVFVQLQRLREVHVLIIRGSAVCCLILNFDIRVIGVGGGGLISLTLLGHVDGGVEGLNVVLVAPAGHQALAHTRSLGFRLLVDADHATAGFMDSLEEAFLQFSRGVVMFVRFRFLKQSKSLI